MANMSNIKTMNLTRAFVAYAWQQTHTRTISRQTMNVSEVSDIHANLNCLCQTKVQRDLRSVTCDNFRTNMDLDSPIAVV